MGHSLKVGDDGPICLFVDADESPIMILPREVVLTACRAMAEAAAALEDAGAMWDLPVGLAAMLEGRAASLDWAGIQLAEQFLEERTARRLHPSSQRRERPAE